MGMTSKIEIQESITTLEKALKSSTNFKVCQRIQTLLLLKKEQFKRQVDLAEYIGIGHSSLKCWIKQYKEFGFDSLTTLKSGGNYKGVINESLHKALEAQITTDLWRVYKPIAKAYNITQIESNKGLNFKALHTMIHQVKSWIRTTYSWVSDHNLDRYFNEFCFRVNRSQSKSTIFNNLMVKMVEADKIYQSEFISN
tara:strand:- start:2013 stop:2603 length:591 start_codon:yes stop_codon:yes gene_type:complete